MAEKADKLRDCIGRIKQIYVRKAGQYFSINDVAKRLLELLPALLFWTFNGH